MLRVGIESADGVSVVEYFARPTTSAEHQAAYLEQFADRTPTPHELRLDLPARHTLMTRWGATITSFGPWVKVPVTAYLIIGQPFLVLAVWRTNGLLIPQGPGGALVLVSFGLAAGVGLLIARAMWRPGKVDTRPAGTR